MLVVFAVVVTWSLSLSIACLGFWAGRLELGPAVGSLWEVGRYPAAIYRQPLGTILTYVIPLAGMITFPAAAIAKTWSLGGLIASMLATCAMVAVALTLFRLGVRRYTGATS